MGSRKQYFRFMPPSVKSGGVIRFMAAADGYVMVRRPGHIPFVVNVNDWNDWPECDKNGVIQP